MVDDVEVVELNEAFACQALAVIKATGLDPARVNVCNAGFASPTLKSPVTITGSTAGARAAIRSRRSMVLRSRDGCDS